MVLRVQSRHKATERRMDRQTGAATEEIEISAVANQTMLILLCEPRQLFLINIRYEYSFLAILDK